MNKRRKSEEDHQPNLSTKLIQIGKVFDIEICEDQPHSCSVLKVDNAV